MLEGSAEYHSSSLLPQPQMCTEQPSSRSFTHFDESTRLPAGPSNSSLQICVHSVGSGDWVGRALPGVDGALSVHPAHAMRRAATPNRLVATEYQQIAVRIAHREFYIAVRLPLEMHCHKRFVLHRLVQRCDARHSKVRVPESSRATGREIGLLIV